MATIQAPNKLFSFTTTSSSPSTCSRRGSVKFNINLPKIRTTLSFAKFSTGGLVEELDRICCYEIAKTTAANPLEKDSISTSWINTNSGVRQRTDASDLMVIAKLYAIMEAVADRVEMHKNIGEQRDNWNNLLLTSINGITLTASTMCGLAAMSATDAPHAAFKISSTVLYLAATAMLAIMNTIQPSQLAEEQRNASRLFKQLQAQIQTTLDIGNPTSSDVNEAMENVLALDRAYPLPLLGAMLEKFPSTVKPAVWWPQKKQKKAKGLGRTKNTGRNGWNRKMEDEMKEITGALKRKDKEDYLKLGEVALKLNKILAISGPLLTGLAAMGSAFVGTNPWAVIVGVVGGALASIVNSIEHGGQVGMVFEMYRGNAGFFKLMEDYRIKYQRKRCENKRKWRNA
ncbi:hypothetical protein MANES_17G025600v8 [Manihot esculenta]|uniref:Uncharacterized protein n=1 Tax=Manihot esculenta TaxID=3983 RepID=A0ACB7G3P6_MANES|nr:hypothetical protein MANES_17G025600v8 [Manihot esculenta]